MFGEQLSGRSRHLDDRHGRLESTRRSVLPAWTPALGGTMIVRPPTVGAVVDIVVWLRSLGLGKYEAAFRENEIDETVLPSLTHENSEGDWRHSSRAPAQAVGCHRGSA